MTLVEGSIYENESESLSDSVSRSKSSGTGSDSVSINQSSSTGSGSESESESSSESKSSSSGSSSGSSTESGSGSESTTGSSYSGSSSETKNSLSGSDQDKGSESLDEISVICENCNNVNAVFYCKKCKVYYCKQCDSNIHAKALSSHRRVLISELSKLSSNLCKEHNKELKHFCPDCKKFICYKCFKKHSECSETQSLKEVVSLIQNNLDQTTFSFTEQKNKIITKIEKLNKIDSGIEKTLESLIGKINKEKSNIEFVLRKKWSELQKSLYNSYQQQKRDLNSKSKSKKKRKFEHEIENHNKTTLQLGSEIDDTTILSQIKNIKLENIIDPDEFKIETKPQKRKIKFHPNWKISKSFEKYRGLEIQLKIYHKSYPHDIRVIIQKPLFKKFMYVFELDFKKKGQYCFDILCNNKTLYKGGSIRLS
ncbi:tripartite motif-containing 59-related [Anaeramoeba flamelloides]|uniref:Tripartite motif-containing 59-related n=1 Tax=Anaeramoeba flamelloides TaxID=1746091 RepID=A0AAV8A927_9EUKA|nr:tripartite motif-containing 59-related [Anaeramoeba flamelloides]